MLVTRAGLQRGRVGAHLGHRRRRRDRGARDREGARRARRSSPRRATRSSRGRASSAPTSTINHATDDVRRRGEGGDRRQARTSSSSTSARRPGSARSRSPPARAGSSSAARRPGPNPPAALHRIWWKQLSILGSTMGTRDGLRGRLRADREPARARRSSTGSSRSPRSAPRTSGSRPASSSARSSSACRSERGPREQGLAAADVTRRTDRAVVRERLFEAGPAALGAAGAGRRRSRRSAARAPA